MKFSSTIFKSDLSEIRWSKTTETDFQLKLACAQKKWKKPAIDAIHPIENEWHFY